MTYVALCGGEWVCSSVPKRAEMVKLVTLLTELCQIIGLLGGGGNGGLPDALGGANRLKRAGHDLAGTGAVGLVL